MKKRCPWCNTSSLLQEYHDTRWGKPYQNDQEAFMYLMMEVFSCGLSWNLVLKKEEILKKATKNFDLSYLSSLTREEEAHILSLEGMIQNKGKIHSLKKNAQAFLKILTEFSSFHEYLHSLNITPIDHHLTSMDNFPTKDEASFALAKDLKKRGFSYLGPILCYSFLQSIGYRNDHLSDCDFR